MQEDFQEVEKTRKEKEESFNRCRSIGLVFGGFLIICLMILFFEYMGTMTKRWEDKRKERNRIQELEKKIKQAEESAKTHKEK